MLRADDDIHLLWLRVWRFSHSKRTVLAALYYSSINEYKIFDFFLASFLYSISFFPIAESFKKGQFDKYCHRVSKVPDAYCLVTMTGYAPPGILIDVISSFRSIILYPKENEHALASHGMFFKLDYLRDQMLNSDFYFHCKFSKM